MEITLILEDYRDNDTCGKSRLYTKLSCDYCGNIFSVQKRHIPEVHACSSICRSILLGTRVHLICATCGVQFTRAKNRLVNAKHNIYFCCRECKDIGQRTIKEIQPPHYKDGNSDYRGRALSEYEKYCNRCGYSNIDALEVHHIDRDRKNNSLSNLEVLCANCHSIEHKTKQ